MDITSLAQALEHARLTGDNTVAAEALAQLETDDLPPEPGEVRRFHIRGTPPEHYLIAYAPADEPPPSFPADLPWIPGAHVGLSRHGGRDVAVHWYGVDMEPALQRILEHSRAAGWVDVAGPRFPTASGAQIRVLEREGERRQVIAAGAGTSGMIQLMQVTPEGNPADETA
jgi:hypothetical protein